MLAWLVVVVVVREAARSGSWVQWDSHRYLAIAAHGYDVRLDDPTTLGWLPGYPMAIRVLSALTPDLPSAGVLAGLVFGALSVLLFWVWTRRMQGGRASRVGAMALFLCYPYAFFNYGAVYSEPLFTALALAAFLLAERRHLWAAGAVAAAATLVRPNGLALWAALVVLEGHRCGALRYSSQPFGYPKPRLHRRSGALDLELTAPAGAQPWKRLGVDVSTLRFRHLALLVPGCGIIGFSVYTAWKWGDPLLFWSNQRSIGAQNWGFVSISKTSFLDWLAWDRVSPLAEKLHSLFQAGLTVGALMLVPRIRRRFGPAYATFVVVNVAMIWVSTTNFVSAGRYLICLFPIPALLAEHVRPRTVAVVAVTGLCLMIFFSILFTRSSSVLGNW